MRSTAFAIEEMAARSEKYDIQAIVDGEAPASDMQVVRLVLSR